MDMRISRNVLNITYRRLLYGEDVWIIVRPLICRRSPAAVMLAKFFL